MSDDRQHLSPELHATVAAGEAPSREEMARLVAHAAALCPRCREEVVAYRQLVDGRAGGPHGSPGREGNHRATGAGLLALSEAFRADRRAATRELWELGRRQPGELRRAVERAFRRFHSPLLAERMIERGRQRLRHDPRQAAEWLEAAEVVALRAAAEAGEHSAPARELHWRTRAQRANALRVAGELPEAAAIFDALEALIAADREVPSLAFQAELASLVASLRQDQRRFAEAEERLVQAAEIYRRLDRPVGEAGVLAQHAATLALSERPDEANRCIERALDLLGPEGDTPLHLSLWHTRGLVLCQLGEYRDARRVLAARRELYDDAGGPLDALARTWLEARIAAGLGESARALCLFQQARRGYLDRGLGYDAAMLDLDLAELHLQRGETAEVKTLAEEMFAVFEARDVHAEAARALRLFQRAATAERLTVELVAALRRYLATSRNDPRHRFRAGGR